MEHKLIPKVGHSKRSEGARRDKNVPTLKRSFAQKRAQDDVPGKLQNTENCLFRQEVLDTKKTQHYGTVSINTPVHYTLIAGGALILIIILGLFFFFASFAEEFKVRGYLNSSEGIVRIYPTRNGVIKKCLIQQGQGIKKGSPLFLIDTSALNASPNWQWKLRSTMEQKRKILDKEITYKTQEKHRLKSLLAQHYVSLSFYHQKLEALMELHKQKNALEVEMLRYKQSLSYIIRSPINGKVSSILYHPGEYVHTSKIMAKILPKNNELIAEIFVPVRNAGFLKKDSSVIIQYDAYPSERFGVAKASIHELSSSILTDAEEDKPFLMREPYYKVKAKLHSQTLSVYGKKEPILHGMTFSAVIIGRQKKLWQWVFDPIYSYYGKLKT